MTIFGRLPGMNEYINAERTNRYKAASIKREAETQVIVAAKKAHIPKIRKPVILHYLFVEPNRRRDRDNISGFAHKVVQDGLIRAGILENDGWNNVLNSFDDYAVDPKRPKIIVTIEEKQ